jgi:multiple sugar transport system substrate-binding protein
MASINLKGITWDHTRGYLPLLAASQAMHDTIPEIEIVWRRRSLKDFGDRPIQELADAYDLLVIDHPFVGFAAERGILQPLEALLPAVLLADLKASSVGKSWESYWFDNRLWALPIDAAAPVSAWRPDLFAQPEHSLPRTWQELLSLAREGWVAIAATPVDCLMMFYMLCCAFGEEPFASDSMVVSSVAGGNALEALRELLALCDPDCLTRNPIATYRLMSSDQGKLAYSPFAFGYSNYAREGYTAHPLRFGDLVSGPLGGELRSTLGGTGLAISSHCSDIEVAAQFVALIVSGPFQRTAYLWSGGQPAHRSAWLDQLGNSLCRGFFRSTLPVLDRAYLRPRYNGYILFQDKASEVIHDYLSAAGNTGSVLARLEQIAHSSRHRSSV